VKFTDSKIKGLKPKDKRVTLFEDTGLGLRVSPTGRKTFIYMYRHNGKQTMLTIGKYPLFSLSRARLEAANLKEKVGRGIDPAVENKAKKIAHNSAPTVQELAEEYITRWAKPRKKSCADDERYLKKEVIPFLGDQKAKDIKRRDIVLLLDKIVDRGSPVSANRVLSVIRKVFNFAVSRNILDSSPLVLMEKPTEEKPRDRVLTEQEVKVFWNALDDAAMGARIKLALRFLLVVGQRRGEVSTAMWSQFDLKKGWWSLPASKTKNGMPHRVALSKMALNILSEIKELSGDSRYLFPGKDSGSPITERATTRAVRNNEDVFGLSHFVVHDIRRSVYTFMKQLGIGSAVVSRVFNHIQKRGEMEGVYDQYEYADEKQRAMNIWSRKLEAIITGEKSKVIQFRKK